MGPRRLAAMSGLRPNRLLPTTGLLNATWLLAATLRSVAGCPELDSLRSDGSVGLEARDDLDFDPVPEQPLDVGHQGLFVDAHQ